MAISTTNTEEYSIDVSDNEHPWESEELLRELYHGKGLTQAEIADELDTNTTKIHKWIHNHGIETRKRGFQRKPAATYSTNKDGRPYWVSIDPVGTTNGLFVHQLVAISDGHEPADVFDDETEVHHKNEIRWDNRPENLELLSSEEHHQIHSGGE